MRVKADRLRVFAQGLLGSAGLVAPDAATVAGCLVEVDLRGIFSHGTRQLPYYLGQYREGELNPNPTPRLVRETPSSAHYDGDGGIGYPVALLATETLIAKALAQGIAVVSAGNHGHHGSVGIYARRTLAHGLVFHGLSGEADWTAPDDPEATVWDAVHSPPICFALPNDQGPPLVVDITTNAFGSQDDVAQAVERFPKAVVRAMGFKFVAALLGGALAGQRPEPAADRPYPASTNGSLMTAFRPDLIGDPERFRREVGRMIRESRRLKPLPGKPTAELPGTLEWQREREWSQAGIPLTEDHRELLDHLAREAQTAPPWD